MNLIADTELTEGTAGLIEELVTLTKLDEKVDRLSTGVIGNIENDRNSMPEAIFNKYKKIVIIIFDSSVLKEHIRTIMAERDDIRKCKEIVGFLQHPQIELMTQREEYSKSPEAMQEMQRFFAGLQASPPTKNRKRLIEQADRVRRSSSVVIDMQVELFQALTWGMRGLSVDGQKISKDRLKQMVLDMKAKLGAHIEKQVWMGMLYAYKDVSDSDLDKYISLHETVGGKLTTEFTQSVFLNMHKQVVNRLQCVLGTEFS